ncbi:MAG: hypothetical protein AAB932_04750 [Patescibacteria group bacterium]
MEDTMSLAMPATHGEIEVVIARNFEKFGTNQPKAWYVLIYGEARFTLEEFCIVISWFLDSCSKGAASKTIMAPALEYEKAYLRCCWEYETDTVWIGQTQMPRRSFEAVLAHVITGGNNGFDGPPPSALASILTSDREEAVKHVLSSKV